jgi:hypothetical protein
VDVEQRAIVISIATFPAAHRSIASSRDLVSIFFRETDWHDTCPPELPLIADAERFGDPSFYRVGDNRMPLPAVLRSRFLNGGIFTSATDLLVWMETDSEPIECGRDHVNETFLVEAEWRSERGDGPATDTFVTSEHAFRVEVGGELLPVGLEFGTVDIKGLHAQSNPGPPTLRLIQTWIMPIASADGRFSVGLGGVPIEDFCR